MCHNVKSYILCQLKITLCSFTHGTERIAEFVLHNKPTIALFSFYTILQLKNKTVFVYFQETDSPIVALWLFRVHLEEAQMICQWVQIYSIQSDSFTLFSFS